MTKIISPKLFNLIQSLNVNEKRNFKLYINKYADDKHGVYIKLFNAVSAQDEYDEPLIRKELKLTHFETAKSRLFTEILSCLSFHNREASEIFKIRNLMTQAEILSERSLQKESDELLRKALKIADKRGYDLLHGQILQQRLFSVFLDGSKKKAPEMIDQVSEKSKALISNTLQRIDLRNISAKLSYFMEFPELYSDVKFKKQLQRQVAAAESMPTKNMSFFEQLDYNEALYLFYFREADYRKAIKYSKKNIDLHLHGKHVETSPSSQFITYVHNYLDLCLLLRKKADFLKVYKLISELTIKEGRALEYYNVEINSVLMEFYISFGLITEGINKITQVQTLIEKKVRRHIAVMQLELFFRCGYVYFLGGRYADVKFWLNKILKEKHKLSAELFLITKTILLICSFAMKDLIDFERNYFSLRRLLKRSPGFQIEIIVIDFLNFQLDENDPDKVKKKSLKALETIARIKRTGKMHRMFGSFYDLENLLRNPP